MRLDQALVERGLAPSRSRARDMVLRGCVRVAGNIADKPSAKIAPATELTVDDAAAGYVSRAALKLVAALDASGFDVTGKRAVDLGASTGGFTQVLLERGAAHVTAVDVGHGQIDAALAANARVTVLERVNARDLTAPQIGMPDVVVSDMSFISLRLAATPALDLAAPGAVAVLLVKPQFEVGREGVGRGGIVTDEALITRTCNDLRAWFDEREGWRGTHFLPSPVRGGDGNREFLLCGEKT